MIKSMTGYGCSQGSSDKLAVTIELRSVNNRFLDCNIRMPRVYTAIEDPMKAVVQRYISRGKVDIYVSVDASAADDVEITVNEPLADAYMAALDKLAKRYALKNDTTALSLARFSDVLNVQKKEADTDQLSADLCAILQDALVHFNAMRLREGEKLYADICGRLDAIERLTDAAEQRSPVTVTEYRNRLEQKMQEVLQSTNIDASRILMEAAIFADKVAVNEEIVRLRSHISQFREILESQEPVGRKLDFLVQELNREANTMGSKGNDVEMARIVVEIKAEIEKIREQIQNVE